MPAPSRLNLLKYRPGSRSIFPTLVFECAITHKSRERLLTDADEKHFHINTSIALWIGLKIKLNADQTAGSFWMGWGKRRTIGWGLRLVEQSEDVNRAATFLPVRSQVPLNGGLAIPTDQIFAPSQPRVNCPNLHISFEEVREAILEGLSLM